MIWGRIKRIRAVLAFSPSAVCVRHAGIRPSSGQHATGRARQLQEAKAHCSPCSRPCIHGYLWLPVPSVHFRATLVVARNPSPSSVGVNAPKASPIASTSAHMATDVDSALSSGIEHLDDHCLLQVCLALKNVQDLACLAMTCKRLDSLTTSSEQIWRTRLYHDFGIPFSVRCGCRSDP